MVLSLPGSTRAYERLIADAAACHACEGMTHSHVLGRANGPVDARVIFVAEAVGRRGGAVTGEPLTRDESGRRFETFLRIAGLERREAFVTNAVLCSPLDALGRNRTPSPTEVARCRPFLARTLEVVRAPLVVALGRVASHALHALRPHDAVLAGPAVAWGSRTLVALYHPSRQSTLHRPHALQEGDWQRLGAIIRENAHPAATPARLVP